MTKTVEYAPGRLVDIHGEGSRTVLLWHGRGPNERATLAPFADTVAAAGLRVVVPDWNSEAGDNGRSDLFLSLKYARESAGPLLLVGWSLGGAAAASLALAARKLGVGAIPVVSLAGGFSKEDPLSGCPFSELHVPERHQGSITLVHGSDDDVVPGHDSPAFHQRLLAAGWSSEITELPVDHFSIVEADSAATEIVIDAATS